MAMDAGQIKALIKAALPDAEVTIRDLAGDGDHYAAEVVSESFRGKNRVQQHQMVMTPWKVVSAGLCTRWLCRRARLTSFRRSRGLTGWANRPKYLSIESARARPATKGSRYERYHRMDR